MLGRVCSALLIAWAIVLLSLFARAARAESMEAPVGGAPIPLGEGRVACARSAGAWLVDAGRRTVRPPAATDAVGIAVDLPVASSAADCSRSSASVTLVATAPWPVPDPSAFTLALDEGRLKGRGRGLAGMVVSWPADRGLQSDTCRDVAKDGVIESCSWAVPKTLPVDPRANGLRWWPAGAHVTGDAILFDIQGKQSAPETFVVMPSRIEVTDLLPPKASVDVASGVGRLALVHPDVVDAVDCHQAHCSLDGGVLVVEAPPAPVLWVDVQFRLSAHVYDVRAAPAETAPVVRVAVLRCPMEVVSGRPLRGISGARAVVRLAGTCMQDTGSLDFFVGSRRVEVAQAVTIDGARYIVLEIGDVRGPDLIITAARGPGEGAVVAVARTETSSAPVVRTTVVIPGFPPVDFIPRNRRAIVHAPHVPDAELVLLPIADVYDASRENGVTTVEGDINAVGLVALEFGYRVPSLPPPLDTINLAVLTDVLQRNVKEANIPAPFGPTARSAEPLAEVDCVDEQGTFERAMPGVTLRLPFSARNGCRLVLHRERLSPEYGTQKLSLEIEVDKVDGSPRPEAHVTQTIVLRAGHEPLIAWLKGIVAPYDRIIVRLSHVADEAHYLGALDIINGEPAVQWTIMFRTGRVRAYATTVVPTGLYRLAVGPSSSSGVLVVSLGVLSRLTWLDQEGHEGLLGLEAGVLALGLAGEISTQGQQLFQVGAVVGLGLSLPIANAGQPAQASVNLHVWFEQLIAPTGTTPAISEQAFIFGPSITLGNVGTTF